MDKDFIRETALKLFSESSSDTLEPFPEEVRRKYFKNGNRSDFEKLYFRRRDYLSSCAVLCLYDESYLPLLEKIIVAVCDEECWALPAHIAGIKVFDNRVIDLFVAETAFALAEISVVFSDRLSLNIHCRIKKEVKKRLLNNYKHCRYKWERSRMNWAAVCGAYTGGALLYLFPEEFRKQKKRLLKTLRYYINGFTDDGFCLEGPLYWLYGFTAYTVFADLLYKFSEGATDLLSDKKVKNIASYGNKCLLKGETSLSFSDSQRDFLPDYALHKYLHSKFPDTVADAEESRLCLYNANTKWMNYYRAIIWDSNEQYLPKEKNSLFFSTQAHVLIVNKENFSFALKGGNNNEFHNHNDLGSFIYSDKDGQVFCDLGSGRYTKDYFDKENRYSVFCNSSFSHSVPVISGKGQPSGKKHKAELSFENNIALCDITKAYNDKAVASVIRKAQIKTDGITITDSFIFNGTAAVTERFVSLRKAEIKDGALIFGDTKLIYPQNKADLNITQKLHTPHEYDKEDITVYCYDFKLKNAETQISFEITTK